MINFKKSLCLSIFAFTVFKTSLAMHISPPPPNQDKKVNQNPARGKIGGSCEEGVFLVCYSKLCSPYTSPYLLCCYVDHFFPALSHNEVWGFVERGAFIADVNATVHYALSNIGIDWNRSCFAENCADGCLGAQACVLRVLHALQEKEKK